MSNLIPLVDLSSNLWRKVRDRWFGKLNEKKNSAGESDFLAERPENWYQGPLIFPAFPEEGVEMETSQPYRAEKVGFYNEEWSD
jgi:hypothetical protein